VILEISQPFGNHNGGGVAFGPDGYLYIGTGDGGAGGDPQENGQNLGTVLGAMLRIDVDKTSGDTQYAIPMDNPFVGQSNARPEIWAYGLRNPWRFSFDTDTGRLWAGDVGQNNVEEIDIVEAGKNYGWNTMEASRCFDPREGCIRTDLVLPVAEHDRREAASITGGYVYRGSAVPDLFGLYVYADYVTGRIWALTDNGDGSFTGEQLFDTELAIAAFGVDANRELYICAFDGHIYKFTDSGE
jgi:glucose/arabinose dehydrogenase